LFHVHGLLGATLSSLYARGSVVIQPKFSASHFWKEVEEYHVTWYSAVPTIHQVLLQRADDDKAPTGKLRFIRSCSSSLAPVILERLEKRFGAPVLEAYGMTEAAHQMASNPLPPAPRKAGTVGKGTNVEIAILDDAGKPVPTGQAGEVCIKGKNVTKGYHNNPKANQENWTADAWFRTGDQGILDAEGYLTLTGRIKELINRGGEKISPVEVDAVLLQHSSVQEAVTFAMPDQKYGEEVGAAIVLKPEIRASRNLTELESEIVEHCKQKLAAFKVPKKFFFADVLPKTATGKIQRRHVAAHFLGSTK
jgi:acyl-CoA synthetase (AMP-forming)/AMP-acid ligase II